MKKWVNERNRKVEMQLRQIRSHFLLTFAFGEHVGLWNVRKKNTHTAQVSLVSSHTHTQNGSDREKNQCNEQFSFDYEKDHDLQANTTSFNEVNELTNQK